MRGRRGLGLAMVPAFDHPWTIAGQGTVAQEIVEQLGEVLAASAIGAWMPEPGQTVVAILSGGNNDVSRYAEIIERLLVYEGRKHYFLVNFPQEPCGASSTMCLARTTTSPTSST